MRPLVFERFFSNDHIGFLEDCSITLNDKTDGSDPLEERNTGEEYWRLLLHMGWTQQTDCFIWANYIVKYPPLTIFLAVFAAYVFRLHIL